MKKNKGMKITVCILVFLCGITTSFGQEKVSEAKLTSDQWYALESSGKWKVSITDSLWISEEVATYENMEAMTDTVFIVKKLPHQMAILKRANNKFALVRNSFKEDGDQMYTAILETSDSIASILDNFMSYEIPKATELVNSRVLYSQAKIDRIERSPGLDEITAVHLTEALNKRKEIGVLLQQYIEQNPKMSKNPYAVYRLAEPFLQREFLRLGYNPFKQVSYNFEEKFKDYPEVLKLLNEPF